MPDRFTVHLERGMATQAVIEETGPVPDIPPERKAAHAALMDEVRNGQTATDRQFTLHRVKQAQNDEKWRGLWLKLRSWYAVAKVTGPAWAKAGLAQIDTSLRYSPENCRKRAEQTRAALAGFPADYTAAGMAAAQLNTEIGEMLEAEKDEEGLLVAAKNQQSTLKDADLRLDRENKDLYQILLAFTMDDPVRRAVVEGIPTESVPSRTEGEEEPPLPEK